MSGGNPYLRYVSSLAQLANDGKHFQLGGFPMPAHPPVAPDAPKALIFSPHPDDECIIGGLALRLQREAGYHVINVAVTQGSNKARQQGRWDELSEACRGESCRAGVNSSRKCEPRNWRNLQRCEWKRLMYWWPAAAPRV